MNATPQVIELSDHGTEGSSQEMDMDSLGSESEYDEKDWDALESGWYHVHRRWLREGIPERITLAGLLGAIGEEAYGPGEDAPVVNIGSRRALPWDGQSELGLLPQGPPALRHLRRSRERRGETEEGTVRHLFPEDTNGGTTGDTQGSN